MHFVGEAWNRIRKFIIFTELYEKLSHNKSTFMHRMKKKTLEKCKTRLVSKANSELIQTSKSDSSTKKVSNKPVTIFANISILYARPISKLTFAYISRVHKTFPGCIIRSIFVPSVVFWLVLDYQKIRVSSPRNIYLVITEYFRLCLILQTSELILEQESVCQIFGTSIFFIHFYIYF